MSAIAAVSYIPHVRISSVHRSQLPYSIQELHSRSSPSLASSRRRGGRRENSQPSLLKKVDGISAYANNDRYKDGGDKNEETGYLQKCGASSSGRALASSGVEYALNKSSKWLISALFAAAIVWKHDAEALWMGMGSVINSWLSMTLKQILKQERPVPELKSGPGMPSSHSQSIFFAVAFVVLSMFQRWGIDGFTFTVGAFAIAAGSYLSWLRVTQQLHTIIQVVVGAFLGTIVSAGWFWLWHLVILKAFISALWVRMIVVLTSFAFCSAFLLYIIRDWLLNGNSGSH